MEKRQRANIVMVAIVAAIAVAGVALALGMKAPENEVLGTEFRTTPIEDNYLATENPAGTCTITILCDTILNNLEALDPAKEPYVPEDGVILPLTTAEFSEGETVFEVLQRVCAAADIQLEYSWTPLYDSYYIEGINHLYEFDCGAESGWMYRMNGAYPNYGCSSYVLKQGDAITWRYTCVGLGEDIGAERMDEEA